MGKTVLPSQFFGRRCWQLLRILSIFADLRIFCLIAIAQPAKTTRYNIRLRLSINYVLAKPLSDLGPVPSFFKPRQPKNHLRWNYINHLSACLARSPHPRRKTVRKVTPVLKVFFVQIRDL